MNYLFFSNRQNREPFVFAMAAFWASLPALLLVVAAVWWSTSAQATSDVTVELLTEPAAGSIIPDATLVENRLRVLDESGQPIPGAKVVLHVDTPLGSPFLTTDFPWVENTSWLNMEAVATDGELEWKAIYPIRGTYTFETLVTLPDGTTVENALPLSINESPNELFNLVVLLAILLAFGILSGFVIGRGQRAAITLLIVGLLSGMPVMAFAHGGDEVEYNYGEPLVVTQTEGDLQATLTIAEGGGRVGALTTLNVELADSNGTPVDGNVTVTAWHIEDDLPVYNFYLPTEEGATAFKVQFFDGAEHDVRVEATTPGGQTIALSTPIEVEGFPPPMGTMIRSLLLLLSMVFVGLLVGFWFGARPGQPTGRSRPAQGFASLATRQP